MSDQPLSRFADVRGHERACAFLRDASLADRLAHSLLFAGPEGVGKHTVAAAFTAWLQCAERAADEACGQCASCRQIAAGSHPDVRHVAVAAGKKEIGVERAREIKRFVQLQPLLGAMKVAVIDDAHLLTVAAQNALLKTLEEPPARSAVILVASNPDALLPTVRSRCQRLQFGSLPPATVVEVLTTRYGIDSGSAVQLASLAEGSPGRALALSQSFEPERWEDLRRALASLGEARYVRVAQLAHELGHPESDAGMKLEMLLSHYCKQARDAGGANAPASAGADEADTAAVRAALRRADAVSATLSTWLRGNPNRQLLLESLLLRLARADG